MGTNSTKDAENVWNFIGEVLIHSLLNMLN